MLAICGGRVFTMAGPVLDQGTVLIKDGKIQQVLQGVYTPPGYEKIDASGKVVMPGLIDAHCHLGIVEEVFRDEGDDCNETTDPVTPHLRVIDAINPADLGFRDALGGGVTTVVVAPGSANVLGGEMAVMKTAGRFVDEMIVRFPAGLKAALGENPKRSYGKEKKAPSTRMASAGILREALARAEDYLGKRESAGEKQLTDRDLKMEAIGRVLKKEVPLRLHAHRADDIMTAVRIAREFKIDLVIEHCTEGHLVAEYLASLNVPAVIGPIITNRAKPEMQGLSLGTAMVMAEKGMRFAIMTDHPVVPVQYLAASAGFAAKGGLPEERALKSITIDAAEILGLACRLGSIEPGKDADIVIFSGHPFDVRSRAEKVYIDGKVVLE
ncbi:MAG: amidohydrolase [Eubacteriales bacterium]|nr:amidohydrolase [Bacillota bacterium]